MARYFIIISLFSINAASIEHKNHFAARFSTGALGYSAIASKSAGLAIPFQLDGTYALTNALELLLGFRGIHSIPLVGSSSYASPYSLAAGFRYYYNVKEPVQAFTVMQILVAVDRFALEAQPLWGLQWNINDEFSVFGQGGFTFLYGQRTDIPDNSEINLGFNVAVGLNYHFGMQ